MKKKPKSKSKTKLGRRAILTAGGSGIAAAALLEVSPFVQEKTYNPELVRPPGSLSEEEFLTKCIRCGECMKVCPTNAIHPATLQGGLAGIWTPIVIPQIGYCEYSCTLCAQVCPTGAIRPMVIEEGERFLAEDEERVPIKTGTAHVDRSRCLPFAYDTDCIVCEEHCPTPDKAIKFKLTQVTKNGEIKIVKLPYVDEKLCIGCGICETKCPIVGQAGIFVTRANADRDIEDEGMSGYY